VADEERIEALELGLTQLADAVETLVIVLQANVRRLPLDHVLEQVANARRLIGTDDAADEPVSFGGEPTGLDFGA
jgi:hypothetical protein